MTQEHKEYDQEIGVKLLFLTMIVVIVLSGCLAKHLDFKRETTCRHSPMGYEACMALPSK